MIRIQVCLALPLFPHLCSDLQYTYSARFWAEKRFNLSRISLSCLCSEKTKTFFCQRCLCAETHLFGTDLRPTNNKFVCLVVVVQPKPKNWLHGDRKMKGRFRLPHSKSITASNEEGRSDRGARAHLVPTASDATSLEPKHKRLYSYSQHFTQTFSRITILLIKGSYLATINQSIVDHSQTFAHTVSCMLTHKDISSTSSQTAS